MEITVQELKQLESGSYQLVDIRTEIEISHGIFPDSTRISRDSVVDSPLLEPDKKLVICCSRGQYSKEVAEQLCQRGLEAVSLTGGYNAWLLDRMQEETDTDGELCQNVEQSLRKKFRKEIWAKFAKAVKRYELVKEGDCIAVCISGGKDSMLMAKLF
ncbi:MAG: ATPase, partial [Lachnospiraceae bacterium]|nr:ATPase [Lachnospiraceae bacterium]